MQRAPKGWRKLRTIGPLIVYQNTTTGRIGTFTSLDNIYNQVKEWDSIEQIEAWLKEHATEQGGIDALVIRRGYSIGDPISINHATIFRLPTGDYAYSNGQIIDRYRCWIMPYNEADEVIFHASCEKMQELRQQLSIIYNHLCDHMEEQARAFHQTQPQD